jgi:hypothetical protein
MNDSHGVSGIKPRVSEEERWQAYREEDQKKEKAAPPLYNATGDGNRSGNSRTIVVWIICATVAAVLVFMVVLPELANLKEVQKVEVKINDIGAVSLDRKDAIESADKAYNALKPNLRLKVDNRDILIAAQEKILQLEEAEVAAKAKANEASAKNQRAAKLKEIKIYYSGWHKVKITDSWTYATGVQFTRPKVRIQAFSSWNNSWYFTDDDGSRISDKQAKKDYKEDADYWANILKSDVIITLCDKDGSKRFSVTSSD